MEQLGLRSTVRPYVLSFIKERGERLAESFDTRLLFRVFQ